jgi:pyruvate dehydrogenase E2 component (dihydrolipoamide acetyltransferase)
VATDGLFKDTLMELRLPDLGEGIDSAIVTTVMVKPGDAVAAGQNVIAVETDKASLEIPSESAGTVESIAVKQGDKIPVGAVILTLGSSGTKPAEPKPEASGGRQPPEAKPEPKEQNPERKDHSPEAPASTRGADAPRSPIEASPKSKDAVAAGPATRRLARELGVSLNEVQPTGRGGRVTLDDIKSFVREERKRPRGGGEAAPAFTMPDFSKYGEIEKKTVANIRNTIAKNLTLGWRTMPMVTQNDLADITDLESGRKRIADALPKGAPKVTMTILAIKAVVAALREFPQFASSYDMVAGELILKKYFHIGIAVDTERGLVVPVVRDADKKSIRDLAAEVTALAEKARAGKLAIDDMRGGVFTITNLGGIGGTSFTPIVNFPEVAILGMSRSSLQPVVKDGAIVPRLMLPLSLTYDHRVIDGADGARFTTRLSQLFSDPLRLLMES